MDGSDLMGTLKGGFGIASKLAGKGFSEVSGMFKGHDEASADCASGLYWQRGPWSNGQGLVPELEFFESQVVGRFSVGLMKRITVSKADRAFMQACGELVSARHTNAQTNLAETVQKDPQHTDGYFLLGCLQLELGQYSPAVRNLQKALLCQQGLGVKIKKYLPSLRMSLPLSPSSSLALFADLLGLSCILALAQRAEGHPQAALESMEQLLGVMPNEPVALFITSILRLELGQYREVVEQLNEVMPDSTIQAANILVLSKACQLLGDTTTAAELCQAALARDDLDNVITYDLRLAAAEFSSGWRAKSELENVLTQCPGYIPLFERIGVQLSGSAKGQSSPATVRDLTSVTPSLAGAGPSLGEQPVAVIAPHPVSSVPDTLQGLPVQPAQAADSGQLGVAQPVTPASGLVASPSSGPQPLAAVAVTDPSKPGVVAGNSVGSSSAAPGMSAAPTAVDGPVIARNTDNLGPLRLVNQTLGLDIKLGLAPIVVGRDEGDIKLNGDATVSRIHARVLLENGGYWVEDSNSTNGTWVNGYRLTSRRLELHRGDSVTFGKTVFQIL